MDIVMERVAVIMAGGRGERLWPKSRKGFPKQFLSMCGEQRSLIASTVERMKDLTDIRKIFVVTGEEYCDITRDQLPELPAENIICEPMGKNTTACIGLAAQIVKKRFGDAIMIAAPSDHVIKDVAAFSADLGKCCEIAEKRGTVVTVGITPTRPETGFGYIKLCKDRPVESFEKAWEMERFAEKPEMKAARRYVASGEYLWNAGMFVFPISYMLECIKRFHPHNYDCLEAIGESIGKKNERLVLRQMFEKMESVSIDCSVMEHIEGSVTVQASFDWNDVGTWAAIPDIQRPDSNGNYITGEAVALESSGNIVEVSKNKMVALLGVKNMVVVESGNAILVCHKDYAQRIKEVTKGISGRSDFL
ncbi:MAG: mannose-1-phosphate guanylyltransferase [Ruminococcaceae bacterium]|nr:mannose-1-phosphate guanylyltransferase [Oscillospiraceae bacterium]